MSVAVNNKDEIIMKLVHYFITEENYQPIIVNGVKNEIWLENLDAQYKVIRINSNYIHNEDQLRFDSFKIKNITKQIKKKTFSLKLKTLNILLDLNEDVKVENPKNIDIYKVDSIRDIRKDENLAGLFPKLKTITLKNNDNIDMIINITNEINEKTEKSNKEYEKIFKPKKIVITNLLIIINVILFLISSVSSSILSELILNPVAVKAGQFYRLITCIFLHGGFLHLLFNMYALYIIGNQVETFVGKTKFLIIYLVSGLCGSLLSCVINNGLSLGASGAIFGLMGCLLYFGYHYRLYLGSVLLRQIVPIIILNLMIGFLSTGIDNAAHIGGLVGGMFISMALGINSKDDKSSKVNGYITTVILIAFLLYLLLFK